VTLVSEVQGVIGPPPSNFLAEFPSIVDLSTDGEVVGTNLALSLGTLLIILLATTMINATVKENETVIGARIARVSGPFLVAGGAFSTVFEPIVANRSPLVSFLKLLAFTGLAALIYSTLDPHFGSNEATAVLVVGLLLGLTFTTVLYEGGQVLFSSQAFRSEGAFRVYPVALAIAIISVALSRLVELNPGVIFGFVAGAALSGSGLGRREHGLIIFVPMLAVLALSLVALLLIGPLRTLAQDSSSAWATLPETVAVIVFVGGAQSVLLSLIPLTFNDGEKVWTWNRYAWLALALPASFLFFHVIVNRNGSWLGSTEATLMTALVLLAFAVGLWLFFRLRRESA
jgi:hypothetical protein